MVHVINGQIINMSRYDSAQRMPKTEAYPIRIGFFRDSGEDEYVSFDSIPDRDVAWHQLLDEIRSQFNHN